jgi:RND family efflux transporter MFP subunit
MKRLYSLTIVLASWLVAASHLVAASGDPVEGFTEPNRIVQVASAETGIVQALLVKVGDQFGGGQIIATLDDDLQRSQVAIVEQQASARGRIKAAEAELGLNQRRYEKLLQLLSAGQAHAEETERARANLEIAEGKLLAEQDEHQLLKLQLERARLLLQKRLVVAPFSGVISELHRQAGEYVSPAVPQVVTLVELDPLKATFLLTRQQLARLTLQQQVKVYFVEAALQAEGVVDSIAPVTDAESGTTAVRVQIANPGWKLRSGERCRLDLR